MNLTNIRVNLCDSVLEAQFGKYNLIGFNLGTTITVDSFPYILFSTIVIQATVPVGQGHRQLVLGIWVLPGDGEVSFTPPYAVPDRVEEVPLIMIQPIRSAITSPGSLNCRVELNGVECARHQWTIEKGEAPNIGMSDVPVAIAGVIAGSSDPVNAILRTASRELTIIDNYLTVTALLGMREAIPPQSVVMILTHPKQQKDYVREKTTLERAFPGLQVKFTKSFHDRWIVVNGCHFYHFGHSLKDASKGSVSRYSQVTSKEEVEDIRAKLAAVLTSDSSL